MTEKLKDRIKFWLDQGLTPKCARCKTIGRASQMTLECGGLPCYVDKQIQAREAKKNIEDKIKIIQNGGKIEL